MRSAAYRSSAKAENGKNLHLSVLLGTKLKLPDVLLKNSFYSNVYWEFSLYHSLNVGVNFNQIFSSYIVSLYDNDLKAVINA